MIRQTRLCLSSCEKILTIELYNVSKYTCNWILCIRYALLFARALNEVVYDKGCDGEV